MFYSPQNVAIVFTIDVSSSVTQRSAANANRTKNFLLTAMSLWWKVQSIVQNVSMSDVEGLSFGIVYYAATSTVYLDLNDTAGTRDLDFYIGAVENLFSGAFNLYSEDDTATVYALQDTLQVRFVLALF